MVWRMLYATQPEMETKSGCLVEQKTLRAGSSHTRKDLPRLIEPSELVERRRLPRLNQGQMGCAGTFRDQQRTPEFKTKQSPTTDQSQPIVMRPDGTLAVQSHWGKSASWCGVELGLW